MATNLDIIKRALRKINVLGGGKQPSADQAADCMQSLQSVVVEMIGAGSLGRLNDVLATSDYTAREWDRIQASHGVTVTLPLTVTTVSEDPLVWPTQGYTLGAGCDYGFGFSDTPRPPYDRAPVVVVQDGAVKNYVFNAQLNAWVHIDGLTQQGDFPFASYLEDGFAALLAERVADEYGQAVGSNTARAANHCRVMISHRPDSAERPAAVSYI